MLGDPWFGSFLSAFSLIGLAEIGDKSQLVCIGLAALFAFLSGRDRSG